MEKTSVQEGMVQMEEKNNTGEMFMEETMMVKRKKGK